MSPLPPSLEALFRQATVIRDGGDVLGALRVLDEVDAMAGAPQVACDVLRGGMLWELNRWDEAVLAMRRVLEAKPRHVLASRVLTHSLLESGALEDARVEAQRYLQLVASGEADRAPARLKQFYREVADASDDQLEELSESLRAEKVTERKDGEPSND